MLDKSLVKKHFSRHAKHYDRYADVQADMADTLIDLLSEAGRVGRFDGGMTILEIGCGTGRLTVELLRRFPGAELTAVDLVPEMIELAQQRVRIECGCGASTMRIRHARTDNGATTPSADQEAVRASGDETVRAGDVKTFCAAGGESVPAGKGSTARPAGEGADPAGKGSAAPTAGAGADQAEEGNAARPARIGANPLGKESAPHAAERETAHAVQAGQIRWIVGDAESDAFMDMVSGRAFDLIVSGATFQWFVRPAATIRRLAGLLKPGGLLAFSTFGPQTFHELRESFRRAERELGLPAVPHGQAFPSGEDWDRWAEAGRDDREAPAAVRDEPVGGAGTEWTMRKTAEREQLCVKTYPDVRAFMHCVKKMGAQNAVSASAAAAAAFSRVPGADPSSAGQARPGRGLGGRKLLHRMETIYAETFGRAGESGIPATYHLLYKIYQKT